MMYESTQTMPAPAAHPSAPVATLPHPALAAVAHDMNRPQEVYRCACELFRLNPDWVTFFREILSTDGVARKWFPSHPEMEEFQQTQEYADIQMMLAQLRKKKDPTGDDQEPTRVITVRLPKSLHESLLTEASQRNTSMNKLCISKLLQVISDEMLPSKAKR